MAIRRKPGILRIWMTISRNVAPNVNSSHLWIAGAVSIAIARNIARKRHVLEFLDDNGQET